LNVRGEALVVPSFRNSLQSCGVMSPARNSAKAVLMALVTQMSLACVFVLRSAATSFVQSWARSRITWPLCWRGPAECGVCQADGAARDARVHRGVYART
jgi:hypothetical protein